MDPQPTWVQQNQTRKLHLYFPSFFYCPHRDEPSREVKSSLSKVKVYTQQMNKNGKLLRLLPNSFFEFNPAILDWSI